jgi:multidrug efflux system outer membrane protein
MRNFLVLAAALLASACAVGPSYQEPTTQVADQFVGAKDPAFGATSVQTRFWTVFDDATLSSLVADALKANHDLRIAAARLAEARALHRDAQFDFGPVVTAGASATRNRVSTATLPGIPEQGRKFDLYDTGFDAVWEIDAFGGVRRNVEASNAEVGGALAALDDTLVTLTSEVGRNYFELRGFQARYAVAQRNANNQRQSLELTQARLDAGRGTELDVARAKAQLSTTLATLPQLQAAVARAEYRLEVLTGRQPGELEQQLAAQPLPRIPGFVPVGSPEDWLRRRPDIRVAERNLAAATARIGVAVSDLFPKITLIGNFGWNTTSSNDVGSADSQAYHFGPSISWAIFDLGHVQARIKAAHARADGALAQYEQTVLQALEDTEGSLVTYSRALERETELDNAATASAKATELARLRYQEGVSDFLQVLDAERTQLEAEDLLATGRTETGTALVAVYKALGAGWQDIEVPAITSVSSSN